MLQKHNIKNPPKLCNVFILSHKLKIFKYISTIYYFSTIFKTFDSDVDKISAKWGVFGRSFNDIGNAITNKLVDFNDEFERTGKIASSWKNTDSIWKRLYGNKDDLDWIKNSAGDIITNDNIDSLIPQISLDGAKDKVADIVDWNNEIKAGNKSWQDYFDTLGQGEQYIVDVVKNTDDLTKLTGDDLVQANQNARQAAIQHNAALKQQTLGAKAASVAMKGLALVGNIALSMLASWAISKVIEGIDYALNAADKITERAEEAKSAIDGIKQSVDGMKATTNDIKDRYAELAQEVENLGKINQSQGTLSTDEYQEFLGLSNQLAELFPQLTKGYDDNGNAILSLSGNVNTIVGSLNNLVDVQQKLANIEILENMSDVWDGYIMDMYGEGSMFVDERMNGYDKMLEDAEEKKKDALEALSFLNEGASFEYRSTNDDATRTGHHTTDIIQEALKNMGLDYMDYFSRDYAGSKKEVTSWDFSSLTEEQIAQLKNALGTLASEYEKEAQLATGKIQSANAQMSGYINAWLSTEWNFSKMAPEMQNVVKDVLLNSDWISMLPDDVDASNWDEVSNWLQQNFLYAVDNIDNEQIETALVDVFNGEFTVESLQGIVDQLKKEEGFDENNPLIIWLNTKIKGAKEFEANYDTAVNKYGAEGKAELEKAFKDNSIDTQEELDNWIEVTKGAENAAEAVAMYAESKKNANKMTVSLSEMKSASDSISALSSAFKQLSDDGYLTTESISKIQEATQLSGDEWEEYQNKLIRAKAGSSEFNQVMAELTHKILENKFGTIDLTNATEEEISAIEDKIEATLRENNVANASAIAQEFVAKKKAQVQIQNRIAKNGIDSVIEGLKDETNWCGLTANAYAQLVAKEIIFNNNDLDVSGKLTKLQSLYGMLGLVGDKWERLNNAMSGTSQQRSSANINAGIYKREGANRQYEWVYNGVSYSTEEEAQNAYMIDQINKDITVKNTNPNFTDTDSSKDNTPDYEDPTDAIINRINLRAKELEQQEESIQNAIEIAELEKDYKKQISLTNDLIATRKKRVEELNTANAGLHNEAEWLRNSNTFYNKDGTESDENLWFDSQGNATEYYNALIKKKGITKEEREAIETLFENISKYKKAWVENDEEIVDLNKEILQGEKEIVDLQNEYLEDTVSQIERHIDKIKEAKQDEIDMEEALLSIREKSYETLNKLAEAQHEADKAIRTSRIAYQYLDEDMIDQIYNEDDYKRVSDKIDEVQDKLSEDTARFLSEVEDAYAQDKLYLVESITAEYERQCALKERELEILQAEIDLQKKQEQLNNVLAEKNVRLLKDGKWFWTHDADKARQAMEELADAEYEYERQQKEHQQQLALDEQQRNIDGLTSEISMLDSQVEKLNEVVENITDPLTDFSTLIDTIVSYGNATLSNAVKGLANTMGVSVSSRSKSGYDASIDYMAAMQNANSTDEIIALNEARNAKIKGENLSASASQMSNQTAIKLWKEGKLGGYASGTKSAQKGLANVNEILPEGLFTNNGTFIPMANFGGGEMVFNHEMMENLWNQAQIPWNIYKPNIPDFVTKQSSVIDNSTHIDKVEVYEPADFNGFINDLTTRAKSYNAVTNKM